MSQAFVAVWQQAVQLAQGVAEQAFSEQRQLLEFERERLAVIEDQACQGVAKGRQQMAEAVAARRAAELRLTDLDLLLSQRQMQIQELQQQRDVLLHERQGTQERNKALQKDFQESLLKTELERTSQESYLRGVEDCDHREIDRAREEGKTAVIQLKAASR